MPPKVLCALIERASAKTIIANLIGRVMVKKIILSLNANHLAPVGAESLCGSRRPVGLTQKR